MKIGAPHDFHDEVGAGAESICPDIEWAPIGRSGTWTVSPERLAAVISAAGAAHRR